MDLIQTRFVKTIKQLYILIQEYIPCAKVNVPTSQKKTCTEEAQS